MRKLRHLGPTLLCAWVLWSSGDSTNSKFNVPWHIQAAYPVYSACVQAARSSAAEEYKLMSKDGDATWGPIRDDRSGQYAATVKQTNSETFSSYFKCLPDTIKKP